jgi:hypothetical protein
MVIGLAHKHGKALRALNRQSFEHALLALEDGDYLVTLEPPKKTRSLDQNAWLWGLALPMIAEDIGYDKHEHEWLHYELLAERFGTVKAAGGLVLPAKTTSKMTTREFSDYMEWLVRFAAQKFGVVVPLPDEGSL